MHLERRPLGGSALVRDYLNGRSGAVPFYAGSPFRLESYRRRAAALEERVSEAALERLRPIIRPAGVVARQRFDEVVAGRGVFVTTGQQPALFGGPLYSLYKALSAIRLAEALAEALKRPVMPLFWVASEDHDWTEANRSHLIDTTNTLRTLALADTASGPLRSLARIRLGVRVNDTLSQLADTLPANDFRDCWIDSVGACYTPEATMASAFADLLADLLAEYPLGIVDAADPGLKKLSAPLLRAEAEDPQASEEALRECADRLERRGYALQVPLIPGATNLFLESESTGRDRLQRREEHLFLRRSGGTIARSRLIALIEGHAEYPHAGEGDSSRKTPEFPAQGVSECASAPHCRELPLSPPWPMWVAPASWPTLRRSGDSLRDTAWECRLRLPAPRSWRSRRRWGRILEGHALAIDEVAPGSESLQSFALDQVPEAAGKVMARWREALREHAAELAPLAVEVDPVLDAAVTRARNAGLGALGALEKKIVRSVKRRNEITWDRIARVQCHLWPAGKPQDRILGPLQYLVRYGAEFIAPGARSDPGGINRFGSIGYIHVDLDRLSGPADSDPGHFPGFRPWQGSGQTP